MRRERREAQVELLAGSERAPEVDVPGVEAGCGIRTSTLLEVGAPVIVQLPGEVGAPCEGVVIWSRRDGSKFTKAGFRSGVKFTKADVMAIEAFMILEADV